MEGIATTFANPEVLAFYKELPFNYSETAANDVAVLRRQNPALAYPILPPLLSEGTRVLDVGCGAGWFSNAIAHYYDCDVTGIDFNPVAVARANEIAAGLESRAQFEVADLFLYEPPKPLDVVVSVGVLHHTNDCVAAVRRLCTDLLRPGGHVMIGLYHEYGRRPFLDHFRQMREAGATEAQMLDRYRVLHPTLNDETHLMSWFRDQVLHPHETQHTLKEMVPVLTEAGLELVSTSINRFAPIVSLEDLYRDEARYASVGEQRLKANQYFPGFFVFLARKNDG